MATMYSMKLDLSASHPSYLICKLALKFGDANGNGEDYHLRLPYLPIKTSCAQHQWPTLFIFIWKWILCLANLLSWALINLLTWALINFFFPINMHCAVEKHLINSQMYVCSLLLSFFCLLSFSKGGGVFILLWLLWNKRPSVYGDTIITTLNSICLLNCWLWAWAHLVYKWCLWVS